MPSDGWVTGTPTPRKESVASSAMARASVMVAITISDGMQLGSMWRNTMRPRRQGQAGRGLDIFLVAFDERRAARGAGEIGPLHQDEGDQHLVDALAQHREQDQRHQDRRKGQHEVDDAHQERVDLAAGIGRDQADHDADGERHHDRYGADEQADAHAVEDRRQHVARLAVGAQPVDHLAVARDGARRHLGVEQVEAGDVERVLRRDPGREQGDEGRDHHQERGRRRRAGSRRNPRRRAGTASAAAPWRRGRARRRSCARGFRGAPGDRAPNRGDRPRGSGSRRRRR